MTYKGLRAFTWAIGLNHLKAKQNKSRNEMSCLPWRMKGWVHPLNIQSLNLHQTSKKPIVSGTIQHNAVPMVTEPR